MNQLMPGIATLLCLVAISGCGGPDYATVPTYPASGQLVINGMPANGAIVRFHPQTTQPGAKYVLVPSGRTNEDGEYHLTTFEGPDGAPPGEYVVTVEWPDPMWRPPGGGMPPPPPDRLQSRFADPKTSTIKAIIEDGDNQIETILLKNVEILKGSSLD